MTFYSILFESAATDTGKEVAAQPECFTDLNLDQVVETLVVGRREYELQPFFYAPLRTADAIRYRQEVGRDIETGVLRERLEAFAQQMQQMRRYLKLIEQLRYPYHKAGWFLEAVAAYCTAVATLAQDLSAAELHSRGLRAFRDYVNQYVLTETFNLLQAKVQHLRAALQEIRYCVLLKGSRVKVWPYTGETDYSVEVAATFEKFRQGAVKDYRTALEGSGMNHVEAEILELVAKLNAELFAELLDFYAQNGDFVDATLRSFDREIQFYLAYLEHISRLKALGVQYCYPDMAVADKDIFATAGFDLALAYKCYKEGAPIIGNDFYLQEPERIIVVTGPNQGGKTTFARMFGQLHYLACLGLPVPAREARLFLCDGLFTHFEREEDLSNLRGKLQDDLVRVHSILERATANSIIIMNEIFNSTTLQDALFLSKKVLERLLHLEALGVWVTFIDELASLSPQIVSMVSTVVPSNPAERTYKLVRQPADGLAYALSIVERYRLTYAQIKERIPA